MKTWGRRASLVYLARVADAAERYDGKETMFKPVFNCELQI